MKKEVQEYLSEVEIRLKDENSIDKQFISELLIRIGFYQHERLVHLIVTMTFAIMTVLAFAVLVTNYSVQILLLSLLFLGLVIPYIAHYYFLENSVQKLYRLYYKALEIVDKK
ncbi:MAG: hypothetical protein IJU82_03705 [Ruminiclostridium sp.]|jgi:hypothetical protein|nr:hypothetical protein [Ruminiclostridium sp.]